MSIFLPFCLAVKNNDLAQVQTMLDSGSDDLLFDPVILTRTMNIMTDEFHMAVNQDSMRLSCGVGEPTTYCVLPQLDAHNVSINRLRLAIIIAVQWNHCDMVTLLLDRGADIESKIYRQQTPLMVAISRRSGSMIRLLVERGANVNAVDINGRTLLMNAIRTQELELSRYLLEYGADVNFASSKGVTALMLASKGHLNMVHLLVSHNADVNRIDKFGDTSLMYAIIPVKAY